MSLSKRVNRIAALRERIDEKKQGISFELAEQKMLKILASTSGIDFTKWLPKDETVIQADDLWKVINHSSAKISSSLPLNSSQNEQQSWLHTCFKNAHISSPCLISLGAFNPLPWACVKFLHKQWLSELLENVEEQDLLLLSTSQDLLCGFIKEENEYKNYVGKVSYYVSLSERTDFYFD